MWREGLVTGNGSIGANLYGGAKREILQLGRHDLWYDGLEGEAPDVHDALARQRKKMDEGNFREASWEIVNELKEKGYNSRLESHIPVANLTVEQTPVKGFRSFQRRLDMEQAVASQQWTDGGIQMRREVFVSRAADMVVYRLCAEAADAERELLEYTLELNAFRNEGERPVEAIQAVWDAAQTEAVCEDGHTGYLYFNSRRRKATETVEGTCFTKMLSQTKISGDLSLMKRKVPSTDFGAVAKIFAPEGIVEKSENKIKVKAADEILVTICLYVDQDREGAWHRLHDSLESRTQPFGELLTESAKLHRALYHSAELCLGQGENTAQWGRTNEDLVMEAFSERQSVELIEKLWHYGRYLFICGSSPITNPFPLYGLWGGRYRLQWCHNMANENLQMIYWHSLCGNLIEYDRAVFKYMNDRIPAFTKNARKLFGIDGIYMTAGTTPGVSSPTQVVPVVINWVGAAGWIAQHYYRYFLYTRDMEYAQNVMLPYMDGVARFYEGFVQFTTDGKGRERIRFYPSVSPENTPANFMPPEGKQIAHPMPTTINSTIDLAILKEFFTNMLAVNRIWEEPPFPQERVDSWRRILKAIPEYKTNDKGAVREWQEEIFEDRYDHRHLSHIYPVFPGYELYPEKNPDQIGAYEKAVNLRRIDAQTGWSMAHMAAIYARFCDGGKAMECLDNMARSSLLNNFFTLHNDWRGMNVSLNMDPAPVQLDAIMGYVNAIQEMLLYAAPGYIALLPALEERLFTGEVRNFRYSDGLIHMKWDRGKKQFECEITPLRLHRVQVALPDFAGQGKWRESGPAKVCKLRENVWELEFMAVTAEPAVSVSAVGFFS